MFDLIIPIYIETTTALGNKTTPHFEKSKVTIGVSDIGHVRTLTESEIRKWTQYAHPDFLTRGAYEICKAQTKHGSVLTVAMTMEQLHKMILTAALGGEK